MIVSMETDIRPRFVPCSGTFNPEVDLQEVDQFGFVNLNECFEKGIVPSVIESTDESFNGVQNPGTLISRSMDVFDGLRKAEYVRGMLDKLSAAEKEKVEKQVEKSVESAGAVTE